MYVTLRERKCSFSTHSSPTVPHLPATAADLCTTTFLFGPCLVAWSVWVDFFNTMMYAWQSRHSKVFTGGSSVMREDPAQGPRRLSYSVGFGGTAPEFLSDSCTLRSCEVVNEVHSCGLTSLVSRWTKKNPALVSRITRIIRMEECSGSQFMRWERMFGHGNEVRRCCRGWRRSKVGKHSNSDIAICPEVSSNTFKWYK